MIGKPPDSHLRSKKNAGRVVHQQDSGREGGEESQSCAAGPRLCAQNNFKNMWQAFAGDSHISLEFGFGIGRRSSRRLQLARHAHNKWIASGQQKRSVGHALFVCSDVTNISARARPHRESAERDSNCNFCCHNYSAQPREGNHNDNTSMQQQ